MNHGSSLSDRTGDVASIDVVVRDLPTPALMRVGGSVMVWGGISHGFKTPLVVVAGNPTAVRYRDPAASRSARFRFGARCSSVVRAFAHGAMNRRIDPSCSR